MPEGGVSESPSGVCPVMPQSPQAEAWALGHHSPDSPASNQTGPEAQAGFFFMLRTLTICRGYKQWVPQVLAFSFFLATLSNMWDLSSQTSDRTCIPCIGSEESQLLDSQKSPLFTSFYWVCILRSQKRWTDFTIIFKNLCGKDKQERNKK